MKNRLIEIDLLRGIAIILVVLGHSFIVYPIDISHISWCASINAWIDTFHMECFFLIAGVCYSCVSYSSYLKKKTKRIAVPYCAFGVITLLLHSYGGGIVNNHLSLVDGLFKFLNGGNYWFLYTLFGIFLLYPLIDTNKVLKVTFLVLGLLLGNTLSLPGICQLKNIVYFLPYFIIGDLISDKIKDRTLFVNKEYWLLVATVVFIALEYVDIKLNISLYSLRYFRAISMIIILYILCIFWGALSESTFSRGINSFLSQCSFYSLQIYLFNGFLLVFFRVLIVSVLGIYNPLVIVIGIVIGNIIGTLLICKLLEKNRFTCFLLGL